MAACVVCKIETNKYRCPKCLQRYCSVTCCRVHKELCAEKSDVIKLASSTAVQREQIGKPCFEKEIHPAFREDTNETDQVPEHLLQELGRSSTIAALLENPHLRAMMENLVNTDKPDMAMASAMQEPIFTELADACLRIVDRENPNLEPESNHFSDAVNVRCTILYLRLDAASVRCIVITKEGRKTMYV
ncbi:zinc finger HIT domain-containing protein 3 [Elysia marginata]|uniref:Zinc finger HIT domain-containing protein 3 n=1 Tax=Elysia marginata TaxID=1093978 RepID=A0AAV4HWH0_9GAST|nr:zinc finger HIT domain-containing protein 3 [Elysia marginata]